MNTALYYPYISITDEGLLKKALLLWDQIEVIDPFNFPHLSEKKAIREAQELVVRSHVPTRDEQERAHATVEELVKKRLPNWFFFKAEHPREFIYSLKFLDKTWELLRERRLIAKDESESGTKWTTEAMALILMAIAADCCAGVTKRKITDEGTAYQTLERVLTARTGGELKTSPKPTDEVLVSVAYKTLDLSKVTLKSLVSLRKKELSTTGHLYTELRHKLLQNLEQHSVRMTTESYSESDLKEIQRTFETEMKRDYSDLAEELQLNGRNFVFSKEFGALILAVAGAIAKPELTAAWAAKGVFTVGSGGTTMIPLGKYDAGRKKILKEHVTSYLYLAKHSGFEWDFRLR